MASILVIDDDVAVQQLIRFVLEMKGHSVRCAGDGIAGLKAMRNAPADLIICDLFMPEMDGLQTIQELGQEFPTLKVIAMSGGSPHDGRVDFLPFAARLGAAATLHKPFSPIQLAEIVERILHG